MMTGSEGVSLRFPQLFLSQHRLTTQTRHISARTKIYAGFGFGFGFSLGKCAENRHKFCTQSYRIISLIMYKIQGGAQSRVVGRCKLKELIRR